MPYSIEWFLEDQILSVQFIDELTVNELTKYADELRSHLYESESTLVHMLLDDSKLNKFPRSIRQFRMLFSVLRDPKVGWNLAFGSSMPLAGIMSSMISVVTRIHFRRVGSQKEALDFLQAMDKSLPDLSIENTA